MIKKLENGWESKNSIKTEAPLYDKRLRYETMELEFNFANCLNMWVNFSDGEKQLARVLKSAWFVIIIVFLVRVINVLFPSFNFLWNTIFEKKKF